MKKLITLVLALLMVLTMIPAMAEELPVVTIMVPDNADVNYPYSFEDRPVLKKICEIAKERFGIELKLEAVLPTEFATVVNSRLAAGQDMPGIIKCEGILTTDMINYFNQGLILDLAQYKEYMPNYLAGMEPYPGVLAATQTAAGNILSMSSVVVNPQHITQWNNINFDWLEALELAVPTTPDELEAVLKAFQENDMNGDGEANEVMSLQNYDAALQVFYTYFGEGQMGGATNSWGVDADGKVYSTYTTEAAKEMATYLNKLWNEGLIWDSSFNGSNEERTQLLTDLRMSAAPGAFWDGLLWNTTLGGYGLKAELAPFKPLGEKITITNYAGENKYCLTSACPVPEKVVAFLDWFFTEEGTQYSYYGEPAPGGDYYVRDTSKFDDLGLVATSYEMQATEKFNEEAKNETNLNWKLGANSIWPKYMPGNASAVAADFYFGYDAETVGRNADVKYVCEQLDWAMANGKQAPLFAAATTEQADALTKAGDLFSYMTEQMKGFISGAISLDTWDAYVAECEAMGLADVEAVMQARYVG